MASPQKYLIKIAFLSGNSEYSICNAFPLYNKNPFATEWLEMLASKYVRAAIAARKRSAEQTAQQGDQGDAHQSDTAASHELFHPQLGVKTLLDGGRRRTKNLYGVVKRTVPAGQVRQ